MRGVRDADRRRRSWPVAAWLAAGLDLQGAQRRWRREGDGGGRRTEKSKAAVAAAIYPTTPMLRIETGMHTAETDRIDIDREEQFLVSGSDDKTVRVWNLQSGGLNLQTLRVPADGEGDIGKVYAVAISPDGRTIAALAGSRDRAKNSYFRSTCSTGRAVDWRAHPRTWIEVVIHLAFSPAGRPTGGDARGAGLAHPRRWTTDTYLAADGTMATTPTVPTSTAGAGW